jgi:serine/threonine protein kinase
MNPRYELQHRLTQREQGAVWRALDLETGCTVALKQCGGPAELLDILHPSVVRVLACDAGSMVMEWVDGETLEAHGRLEMAALDQLVIQSLSGLAALHAAGLLHLDLKPENILISDSRFLISDLGSVRRMGDAGGMVGSIHYMAPEFFERGVIDVRTDLYALGCTFYFALCGRTAFEGELKPQVITAHLQHRVEPLPGALGQWIEQLMSRQAALRPASAQEARAAYEALRTRNPNHDFRFIV